MLSLEAKFYFAWMPPCWWGINIIKEIYASSKSRLSGLGQPMPFVWEIHAHVGVVLDSACLFRPKGLKFNQCSVFKDFFLKV